jgi:two-component system copper resistance phosphate regulon response regulator CusR
MKLLVVDDEVEVRDYVCAVLEDRGIRADTAEDAEQAERLLSESPGGTYDLVLLDASMPGRSGWDLLERMRAAGNEVPVIFITGMQAVEDRIRGLHMGADDYIVKPFEPGELVARVQAVVRRRNALPVLEVGGLRVDLARRIVEREGKRIDMSPREFDLLRALAEKKGRVLSRADLLRTVWGMDFDPGTNVVEVQVARLRRKVEQEGPPLIETRVGEGYVLRDAD